MTTPPANQSPEADNKAKKAKQRRKIPVWKKALFGLLATAMFFTAVELLLAVFGVNPVTYSEDPFVGFTKRSPLFEKVKLPDNREVYRTASNKISWFNQQEFPVKKARKDYRIFCMGGSTTYGRPYNETTAFSGWLREYLNAADSKKQWYVINAGGISYASYRIASLMEELIEYEPDMFIIYCGHNEFLERRTYGTLMETSPALLDVAAILSRSRIYTSGRKLFGLSSSKQSQAASESYELTEEVESILDHSIGPDDYKRDDRLRSQIINHYQFNLQRMIEIAQSVGARVVLVTPAANERHMSPFKNQHRDNLSPTELSRWEELIAEATELQKQENFEESLSSLDRAIEIDGLYAQSHFLRGQALFALKRYEQAKQAFRHAIDEDVCPLRVLSEMKPIVAKIASENDIASVDFPKILDEKTDSGIHGNDWFLDHVHPTIEGHRTLALSLFDELQSLGIVEPQSDWNDETRQRVVANVMGRVDERAHGIAIRNLAKVLTWARKHEESSRLIQTAAKTIPDDAEVHFLAGLEFGRQNQLEQASKSLEKVVQMLPRYALAHYNLAHIYRRMENWELAEQSFQRAIDVKPDYPRALYNLGLLLLKKKELDRAADCFLRSTQTSQPNPQSWEHLGTIRLKQGRLDEAIRHLEKAIQLEPKLATAHNSLGVAFAQRGQIKNAAASFKRALAITPNYPAARKNLQRTQSAPKK